ncbi:hypothetical protein [Aeromicrobium wangtongii]|uniref:DUF4190 domain-containing protein n=1 Tax=Aeromicrobium wangtongii TaxID=2969247 RepID=A0ABY5M5X1_9ACTN|nr:hypothetical protein [Aeromicrobium wangtongii]MCD9198748.1 hypothetical protein [Aeromicrobium wangtongii]UUP13207.1 hypothetical protein NQV15_15310 [Aeromicrobium wangtongii]
MTTAHPGFAPTAPPKAPGASLSLVLGIISVAGLFVLVVPVFLAPLAWYHGVAAGRRVEREPDRWSGRGEARAGAVLGMIGSALALLVLAALALAGLGVLLASAQGSGYRS